MKKMNYQAEYLSRHSPEGVTEAMNRVVDQLQGERDPFSMLAAKQTLDRCGNDGLYKIPSHKISCLPAQRLTQRASTKSKSDNRFK